MTARTSSGPAEPPWTLAEAAETLVERAVAWRQARRRAMLAAWWKAEQRGTLDALTDASQALADAVDRFERVKAGG